jgi:apolipoprotein N-acyltransferase
MGRKTKNKNLEVWQLFILSAILLTSGWLMRSFPLLIFAAYSPIFEIVDRSLKKNKFLIYHELLLGLIALALLCATFFNFNQIFLISGEAITITAVFAVYIFARQNLGERLGKFTIIFFWLAIEYIMLKLPWTNNFIFLSDALELKNNWWGWTIKTGYLGISFWIVVVNLIFYNAFFKHHKFIWQYFILAILFIGLPIMVSYLNPEWSGISRSDMIFLYANNDHELADYKNNGELISRTAAWISVLILLLSVVKNKTNRK